MPNGPQLQVNWVKQLLGLGYLNLEVNVQSMVNGVCWAIAEGGWINNQATYNCYNTEYEVPGSVGVIETQPGLFIQAYQTEEEGLQATYDTLQSYPDITSSFGDESEAFMFAVADSSWGTLLVSLQNALPAAEAAVAEYYISQLEGDNTMLAEDEKGHYYRLSVYTPDTNQKPGTTVEEWREIPASEAQNAQNNGVHIYGPAMLALWEIHVEQ